MTTAADPQIVPRPPAAAPALRAADEGVADALTSVLSDNTGVGASLNRRKVRVCCTCLKVVLGSKSELLLVNTVPKDLDV